jgi:hypothetical protein
MIHTWKKGGNSSELSASVSLREGSVSLDGAKLASVERVSVITTNT